MTKIQINHGNGNRQEADDDTVHQIQISLGWKTYTAIIMMFVLFWSTVFYFVF